MEFIFKNLKIVCILPFLFCSCSSLLFQPSHISHFPPQMVKATPQDIWLETPDSGKIHGWHFHSTSKIPARTLVLHFHGNSGNVSSHYLSLFWLTAEPIDYIIFDYRGYGLSVFGNKKSRITKQSTIEDGALILDHASKYAKEKNLKLVILAQSLGGAIFPKSLEMVRDKVEPDLIFLDSTFHSYQEAGRSVISQRWWTWPFQPLAYLLLDDDYSPKETLPKLSPIPIVLIHGDDDRVIKFHLGEKTYSLLGQPKEFWRIPNGTHIDFLWRHQGVYRQKFLKKILELSENKNKLVWKKPTSNFPDLSYSYKLPFSTEKSIQVLQADSGHFSHNRLQKFAIDFKMDSGNTVLAARQGEVIEIISSNNEGQPKEEFKTKANYIIIQHEDGTFAEYVHLKKDSIFVKPGEIVKKGQIIAQSGNSGYSSKPHLHFMVFIRNEKGEKQSLPILFQTSQKAAEKLKQHEFYTHPVSNL